MAANNWDIKIIKEETQTTLYFSEYHQIALSIIFFHLLLTCMGLHMFLSNINVRIHQHKLILFCIQMVTYSAREEWKQHIKRAAFL